jgi:hypothetical protein
MAREREWKRFAGTSSLKLTRAMALTQIPPFV